MFDMHVESTAQANRYVTGLGSAACRGKKGGLCVKIDEADMMVTGLLSDLSTSWDEDERCESPFRSHMFGVSERARRKKHHDSQTTTEGSGLFSSIMPTHFDVGNQLGADAPLEISFLRRAFFCLVLWT